MAETHRGRGERRPYPSPVARTVAQPRRVFAGVSFAALAGFISLGAVVPALPRLVTGPLDGGDLEVGLAVGAFGIGAIVVPAVPRSHHRHRRPPAGDARRPADDRRRGRPLRARRRHGRARSRCGCCTASGRRPSTRPARRGRSTSRRRRGAVRRSGSTASASGAGRPSGRCSARAPTGSAGSTPSGSSSPCMPLIGAATVCVLRADRPPARPRGPRSLIPAAARGPGLALALASVGVAAVTGFGLLLAEDRDISGGALVWPAFAAGPGRRAALLRPAAGHPRRAALRHRVVPRAGPSASSASPPRRTCRSRSPAPALAGGGSALVFPALALLVVGRTPGRPARRGHRRRSPPASTSASRSAA